MTGIGVLYAFEPNKWLFLSFLSGTLIAFVLLLPLAVSLLEHSLEDSLRHFTDTTIEYYSMFFFLQSDVPKNPESKIVKFFLSFSILIFLTFYLGSLTEEFHSYKNFGNIDSVEDIYNVKIYVYAPFQYMLMAVGGKIQRNKWSIKQWWF